ncbi:cytochrome ubiquinol oxidase subunit I [Chitinimonas arctica]|uniref:Cytochrome ubiquinol oxidase subunit I n=1 Tax=Chitinimonas arctica TaxID=2594795 RepID=A0A516SBN4_9NEIS|nr:cytochrome ubiquinol oxidase subunit I [Chitinimonas arctica]QDQ25565.1 cytochrome ubiquinol oxidase subunit I [Chitinimonas arctica]
MPLSPAAFDFMRVQFAVTASYHYLFVPITLGLILLIALMEGAYLYSRDTGWRTGARFWSRFFFFAWCVGLATGLPLRWQLTHNWAGYSDYVREVLSRVLSIEGIVAPIMLVLTCMMVFGWDRLNKYVHFAATCLLGLVLCIQASTILTMNAWMQHPVGVTVAEGRAVVISLEEIFRSPVAFDKISHALPAAVVIGCLFVLAICAWYCLQGKHLPIAHRSFKLAAVVGLVATLATVVSGHHSARSVARHQPLKFAAIEALWRTEAAPAPLTLLAVPDRASRSNRYEIQLPYLLSLLGNHRLDQAPKGMDELVDEAASRIRHARHDGVEDGYDLLSRDLEQRTGHRVQEADIAAAANRLVPNVPVLFYSFRLMVGCGLVLSLLFGLAVWRRKQLAAGGQRWLLRLILVCLPLPWLATLAGWMVAEVGRQPWVVYGMLPTAKAVTVGGSLLSPQMGMLAAAGYLLLALFFCRATLLTIALGPQQSPFSWDNFLRLLGWRAIRPRAGTLTLHATPLTLATRGLR